MCSLNKEIWMSAEDYIDIYDYCDAIYWYQNDDPPKRKPTYRFIKKGLRSMSDMNEIGLVKYDGSELLSADIRESNLQNLYWRNKEGRLLNIKDMPDSYLRNIALMLIGMGYQRYECDNRLRVLWLAAFRLEWERRMNLKVEEERK